MQRNALITCALLVTVACNKPPGEALIHIDPAEPVTSDDLVLVIDTAAGDENKNDVVTHAITWTVDGVESTEGDTVPSASTSKGQVWEATVVAADDKIEGLAVSVSVQIGNTAPLAEQVQIGPNPATTSEDLVVTATGVDADSDEVSMGYVWHINGIETTQTDATLDASAHAKGDSVTVVVTPYDGEDYGEPVESSAVIIDNTPPVVASAQIQPLLPKEADTLTCVPTGWQDDDGDDEGYDISWDVNGTTVSKDELTGADFDKHDDVSCTLVPNDGDDLGDPVTSATVEVQNTQPILGAVAVAPTEATVMDTLTASYDPASDDDGDTLAYEVLWTVNGTAVGVGETLDLATYKRGDRVVASVTPSDDDEAGATVASETVTIGNSLPVMTSVTTSPGAVRTNDSLTASYTATDADADRISVTWSWTVNGAAVKETSSTLDGRVSFKKGDSLIATAVPNDGFADGVSMASAPVKVLNSAPSAPELVSDPAEPGEDDSVQCVIDVASTDADEDSLTYTFSWAKDGVAWTGSTTDTDYKGDTIDSADLSAGEEWTCTVVVTDGSDSVTEDLDIAIVGLGCVDGTVEVTWSSDVHGCKGPSQYWRDYNAKASSYCATGWKMAGASVVNAVLTKAAYTEDVKYAFNGEGCDGHNQFATRHDAYAQTRGACSWASSHHWSLGSSGSHTGSAYLLQGVVCERK